MNQINHDCEFLESERIMDYSRLTENLEAKIVDPDSREALPPGKQGELWLQGHVIMKGYIGNEGATAATLDSEGWLKTRDMCYFDSDGFLFIINAQIVLIIFSP